MKKKHGKNSKKTLLKTLVATVHCQYLKVYIETLQNMVWSFHAILYIHTVILKDIQEIRILKRFNMLLKAFKTLILIKLP